MDCCSSFVDFFRMVNIVELYLHAKIWLANSWQSKRSLIYRLTCKCDICYYRLHKWTFRDYNKPTYSLEYPNTYFWLHYDAEHL